ncbi:MAG: hypothetical protein M3R43_00180 [Acidobacteriota bacterium]|nr:hypothetical protein [Acidobacteriota bacterium]
MTMRRRTHRSLFIALALLAAVTILLVLRKSSPPEVARLLPESDAILYVHLKPLRTLTHFDATPVVRSPDYQRFVDATGIVPERDLDAVAFALHRMSDPRGPNGPVAYSEVFEGRFDGMKLARYLASIASARETYAGHDIYTIPIEGRQLRIAQVGYDTIAASNMPTAEQIHSMLDRHRASALWAPGSSLLAARYQEVPLLSQAWAIGHIGLPFVANGHVSVLGLELPLNADTDLVASLRYSGSIHLRVEEIAPTDDAARRTVETMSTLLNILRGIQSAQPAQTPAAEAMRKVIDSVAIEHRKDRAVLTAAATTDEVRALTSAANAPAKLPANAAPATLPASKH